MCPHVPTPMPCYPGALVHDVLCQSYFSIMHYLGGGCRVVFCLGPDTVHIYKSRHGTSWSGDLHSLALACGRLSLPCKSCKVPPRCNLSTFLPVNMSSFHLIGRHKFIAMDYRIGDFSCCTLCSWLSLDICSTVGWHGWRQIRFI
jgi:hypothetical protein